MRFRGAIGLVRSIDQILDVGIPTRSASPSMSHTP
jgi:hypothetical protein